jgi:hypothetical protein
VIAGDVGLLQCRTRARDQIPQPPPADVSGPASRHLVMGVSTPLFRDKNTRHVGESQST